MKRKITIIILILFITVVSYTVLSAQTLPNDITKSLVLDLSISNNELVLLDGDIVYGHAPDRKIEHTGVIVRLLSQEDGQLEEYYVRDPRISFEENRAVVSSEANFTFVMPFFTNLKTVNIFEQDTDVLIGSVDVSNAIENFCQNNINDPNCIELNDDQNNENEKIMICHIPPGNPGNAHTITIGKSALKAHKFHGDYEGKCQSDNKIVPKTTIQSKLINNIINNNAQEKPKGKKK